MREKQLFDSDWMFHRGDLDPVWPSHKAIAYRSAKTERYLMGPAAQTYQITDGVLFPTVNKEIKTEKWIPVELPHDYMAGDEPREEYNQALGYCKYDNAWYVKRFVIPKEDEGKRLSLLFDGIATHATVTLNGCLIKRNFCGYTPFEADITDMAKYGEENLLAVHVSTKEHEGWWYEGAGIYRHVWLIKTDPVAIDLWGVYARPELAKDNSWSVETEVTVRNDTQRRKSVRIKGEILDADGCVVATAETAGLIDLRDKRTLRYRFAMKGDVHLWSPETPYQYVMRTAVFVGKRETDVTTVKFGFRTIRMDKDEGLFINEKNYVIKGVCAHESCGYTGKAVPDDLQRYRLKLIKEMGANGYRTAHYPHSEAMMDALDENGFIVMDETRWFDSSEEGREQLTAMILRDRNRPSVIFWSIGNEEPHHCTDQGVRICRSLVPLVKKLDPTRPVTTAITHVGAKVYDEVDVVGINYLWKHIDSIREENPQKPFVSSENCATGTTRGWYFEDDPKRGLVQAYDRGVNSTFLSREENWKRLMSYPWMKGGYQWNAFEYRGEAAWPRISSVSGAIDLYLQKKDAFYQNQSHWTEAPMIHLLPHWNFSGLEGEKIRVVAYTNQPSAELFLNGQSLGVCEIEPYGHAEWMVPYAPGKIEVRGMKDGKVSATDLRVTTGKPVSLKLILDTPSPRCGDTAIVTCVALDENGNEVPDACPVVGFAASGGASIYSTGSSNTDHVSIFSPDRKMWMGRVGAAVKLPRKNALCRVYAMSEGLTSACLMIEVKE